jgi:hypothetical protein
LSWQNLLNSPGEVPPVFPLVPVPVVPVPDAPVPVPVPPPVLPVPAPPVPAPDVPLPVVPVPVAPVPVLPVVPVPVAPDDDWLCDWLWLLDEVLAWSAELALAAGASAAVPAGSERFGTVLGTASWLALLLPQALMLRAVATARSASSDVRMALRVARR